MTHAKQTATERSEGGSDNRHTRRSSDRTERVVVRLSKAEMVELEQWADENGWTLAGALRAAFRRSLQAAMTQSEPHLVGAAAATAREAANGERENEAAVRGADRRRDS